MNNLELPPFVEEVTEGKITQHEYIFTDLNQEGIYILLVKMDKSNLVWIGKRSDTSLTNLNLALPNLKSTPVSTLLFGDPIENDFSIGLSQRLAKKYGHQFYISYQISPDPNQPELERLVEINLKKFLDQKLL